MTYNSWNFKMIIIGPKIEMCEHFVWIYKIYIFGENFNSLLFFGNQFRQTCDIICMSFLVIFPCMLKIIKGKACNEVDWGCNG